MKNQSFVSAKFSITAFSYPCIRITAFLYRRISVFTAFSIAAFSSQRSFVSFHYFVSAKFRIKAFSYQGIALAMPQVL
jgi:hypothetical protein